MNENVPVGNTSTGPDYARDVRIRQAENGFIAEIGCKTFVSQDWKELAAGMAEYWDNPKKAEAKFSRKN